MTPDFDPGEYGPIFDFSFYLKDVVPEVKKRVADLNALKTFADLSGHTSKETEELKQGQDEMDEILVR